MHRSSSSIRRVARVSLGLTAAGLLAAGTVLAQAPAGSFPPTGASPLVIGLVTDAGTIEDGGIDQASWAGTLDAATRIGAALPTSLHSALTTDGTQDIETNIQTLLDAGTNVIVTVGYAADDWTLGKARQHPEVHFIGIDQGLCLTAAGDRDTTGTCAGDAAALVPNLQALTWSQQQAGYLAGIVAASISKSGHIAAIGRADSPWITNDMIGYRNGAMSVEPAIKVDLPLISTSPDAWEDQYDPAAGKAFTEDLLAASPDIDVVFQAAGGAYDAGGYHANTAGTTGAGILEATCAREGVYAIGEEVDQHLSLAGDPAATKCLVTSAMNSFATSVSDAILRVSDGTATGGAITQDLSNAGVGLAPFYDFASLITPDIQAKIDAAAVALADGSLTACVEDPGGACADPSPAG